MLLRRAIQAQNFWNFLKQISKGTSMQVAWNQLGFKGREKAYRLFSNFKRVVPSIRTKLCRICDPPFFLSHSSPFIQTIEHLKQAFEGSVCPIQDFQIHFQSHFLE